MKYLDLQILRQVEGNQFAPLDISLNLDHVYYILKQPLQPIFIGTTGAPLLAQIIPEEVEGFFSANTKESGTVLINPSKVIFHFSPELGVYTLAFPDTSQIAISITGAELRENLNVWAG